METGSITADFWKPSIFRHLRYAAPVLFDEGVPVRNDDWPLNHSHVCILQNVVGMVGTCNTLCV